jgi:hypothetical protein
MPRRGKPPPSANEKGLSQAIENIARDSPFFLYFRNKLAVDVERSKQKQLLLTYNLQPPLREAQRRDNTESADLFFSGLLRFARNGGDVRGISNKKHVIWNILYKKI